MKFTSESNLSPDESTMKGTTYSGNTFLGGKESHMSQSQSTNLNNKINNRDTNQIKSQKFTSSSDKEILNDQVSYNMKTTLVQSESSIGRGTEDELKNFASSKLTAKLRNSINQVVKEQRSLSVGSLPTDLKSHILKTIHHDHLVRDFRMSKQSEEGTVSETLNKIRELPEEYEKANNIGKSYGRPLNSEQKLEQSKRKSK